MTTAFISHPECLLHDPGLGHPEQPDRLRVIDVAVMNSGLNKKLQYHLAPQATQEQLLRVHDKNYIEDLLQKVPQQGLISLDPDTFMNSFTMRAALRAAGATVQAVDLIMANEINSAFCNIRPPGHHAERARAMGFSFFNNVAVGVAHALQHHHLKRIAIVDFDVHLGNGTEDIFLNDKRVLICSTFQYPFYPFRGGDVKSDHIINIPLPAGTGSREYRATVEQNWFDAIRNFKPQMIFFSAGFDGHFEDPIAHMELTELDFAWLTRHIKQIADECCDGKIVSVLEGGYALNVLGECVVAHIEAML